MFHSICHYFLWHTLTNTAGLAIFLLQYKVMSDVRLQLLSLSVTAFRAHSEPKDEYSNVFII